MHSKMWRNFTHGANLFVNIGHYCYFCKHPDLNYFLPSISQFCIWFDAGFCFPNVFWELKLFVPSISQFWVWLDAYLFVSIGLYRYFSEHRDLKFILCQVFPSLQRGIITDMMCELCPDYKSLGQDNNLIHKW